MRLHVPSLDIQSKRGAPGRSTSELPSSLFEALTSSRQTDPTIRAVTGDKKVSKAFPFLPYQTHKPLPLWIVDWLRKTGGHQGCAQHDNRGKNLHRKPPQS